MHIFRPEYAWKHLDCSLLDIRMRCYLLLSHAIMKQSTKEHAQSYNPAQSYNLENVTILNSTIQRFLSELETIKLRERRRTSSLQVNKKQIL